MIGAPEMWAGKQWEQSPPDIDSYATFTQKNAWRLKVGLETGYEQGSTPQRLFYASSLLWDNGLGCIDLFEDAMLANPGYHFSAGTGTASVSEARSRKSSGFSQSSSHSYKSCCTQTKT